MLHIPPLDFASFDERTTIADREGESWRVPAVRDGRPVMIEIHRLAVEQLVGDRELAADETFAVAARAAIDKNRRLIATIADAKLLPGESRVRIHQQDIGPTD